MIRGLHARCSVVMVAWQDDVIAILPGLTLSLGITTNVPFSDSAPIPSSTPPLREPHENGYEIVSMAGREDLAGDIEHSFISRARRHGGCFFLPFTQQCSRLTEYPATRQTKYYEPTLGIRNITGDSQYHRLHGIPYLHGIPLPAAHSVFAGTPTILFVPRRLI